MWVINGSSCIGPGGQTWCLGHAPPSVPLEAGREGAVLGSWLPRALSRDQRAPEPMAALQGGTAAAGPRAPFTGLSGKCWCTELTLLGSNPMTGRLGSVTRCITAKPRDVNAVTAMGLV